MADEKELDVSNTIIVKALKHGMTLEAAESMAEELAEEEAETIEGQTKYWLRRNWSKVLAWFGSVATILGGASLAYLVLIAENIQ